MTEYNGWTNKATWLVKLWIDNDQGEQEYWLDTAKAVFAQNTSIDKATYPLAQVLKESYSEAGADLHGVTGFWADLLGYALATVNWGEIAHALIEDAAEVMA